MAAFTIRPVPFFLSVFLCGAAAVAREHDLPARPSSPVNIKSAVELVLADTLVVDPRGKSVAGLRMDDFELFDSGVRQQISYFGQDQLPLSLVLLVDRGGCLDPYSETVRSAMLEILRNLKPHDKMALLAFSDRTTKVLDFTRDETLVSAALSQVPEHESFGGHCFNRALSDAAHYLRDNASPDSRRVVVVITAQSTGLCNSGPSSREVSRALMETGAVIYGLLPRTAAQILESGAYRAGTLLRGALKLGSVINLHQVATETGGEIFHERPEMLAAAFTKLTDHLRARYILGFTPSNPTRDGKIRRLKIRISAATATRLGGVRILARRGYVASTPGP